MAGPRENGFFQIDGIRPRLAAVAGVIPVERNHRRTMASSAVAVMVPMGHTSFIISARSRSATTTRTRPNMVALAITVANVQGPLKAGVALACAAMAAVTAVDEVRPPNNPVNPNPFSAPRNLVRKYPTKTDTGDQDHQESDFVRIENPIGIQSAVGQQRQHHQNDGQKLQCIRELHAFQMPQRVLHEPLERQQDSDHQRQNTGGMGAAIAKQCQARSKPRPRSPW